MQFKKGGGGGGDEETNQRQRKRRGGGGAKQELSSFPTGHISQASIVTRLWVGDVAKMFHHVC